MQQDTMLPGGGGFACFASSSAAVFLISGTSWSVTAVCSSTAGINYIFQIQGIAPVEDTVKSVWLSMMRPRSNVHGLDFEIFSSSTKYGSFKVGWCCNLNEKCYKNFSVCCYLGCMSSYS